ncbi:CaiB/BaiF CoA transferase family protein [Arenibacterium halophilum]|uniref:CoA transferase n=1 Tax=Arenibacterium halophilum TaxID=2583821 RepID=A0ABY2X9T9_9RHOB|nr:CoA transferase [Arenibacterium halophilum]TMV13141.1 CoA transferase [Arenibacterium halophilum]
MNDHHAAFAGLKVLDFTAGVAGPHATQIMALHGAEVIKVEPLKGEWGRTLGRAYGSHTAHSIAFNRGKKSLAVDLKNPEILAAVKSLARSADIIAESFRPGVMARFGLSYDQLTRDNTGLIYLSISGFGQTGPYVERPVTDAVIQAFSGWMTMNADSRGVPQRSRMVAMDVMTGLYGCNAVAMAMIAKLRFGHGKWIDCSLMQSAAAFQTPKMIEYHLQNGDTGNLYAPVGAFPTRDGQINITTMRDDHFAALCRVLEREQLADEPRFKTATDRLEHETELNAILFEAFAERDSEDWAARLTKADLMNSVVYSYSDYFQDKHVTQVGSYDWLDHPRVGPVPVPGVPGAPESFAASPEIGQHSVDVLHGAGLHVTEIERLSEAGAVTIG